jgi:hypothetical protein
MAQWEEEVIGSDGLQSVHNSHSVQNVESDCTLRDVYFEKISSTSIKCFVFGLSPVDCYQIISH